MRRLLLATIIVVFGATFGLARVRARAEGEARGQQGKSAHAVRLEPGAVGVRILFGLRDMLPTRWSGSIAVTGGSLISLEGWHFRQADRFTGPASWNAFTRFGPA